MSQVFTATVVVAGPTPSLRQLDALLEHEYASAPDRGLHRSVLCDDARLHCAAVQYVARSSRYRPVLWRVAGDDAMASLGLVTLGLLYGEQGDGTVFVEHGAAELFANPSIYGFSDEGDDAVHAACRLFAQAARDEFGLDAAAHLSMVGTGSC